MPNLIKVWWSLLTIFNFNTFCFAKYFKWSIFLTRSLQVTILCILIIRFVAIRRGITYLINLTGSARWSKLKHQIDVSTTNFKEFDWNGISAREALLNQQVLSRRASLHYHRSRPKTCFVRAPVFSITRSDLCIQTRARAFSSLAEGLALGRCEYLRACERENQLLCVWARRKRETDTLLGPQGRQEGGSQLLEAIRQTAIRFPPAATVSLLLLLTRYTRALPALYLADQTSAPHPTFGAPARRTHVCFVAPMPQPHP